MSVNWAARTHWIFDMDGTLTVPAHDFAGFKREHGIPEDQDLLSAARERSPAARAELMRRIREWELQVAATAQPQPDAIELLRALHRRGATCGVLTRNTRENAIITLRAAGMTRFFPDARAILGRDCAPPKPDPAGVTHLLNLWSVPAQAAVMVGDWVHDVAAGHAAGTATVLILRHGPANPSWMPYCSATTHSLAGFV